MALTKVSSGLISADASSVDLNIDAGTLYIDATNNLVGIGTTSPSTKLEVNGGTDNLLATFKSTDDLAYISFQDNGTTSDTSAALGANDNNLVFFTGTSFGSERMRIDSSGNVGIGTSSPSEDLHVSGIADQTIAVESTSTGAGANAGVKILAADGGDFLWQTGNATGNALRLYDLNASAERMRIDSSGNVRIGATTGFHKVCIAHDDSNTDIANGYANLELSNPNGTNGTYSRIVFNDAAGGPGSGILGVKLTDTTNNYGQFEFWTRSSSGGSTKMVIDPNGNVGIGESAPANKLHVKVDDIGLAPIDTAVLVLEKSGTNYINFMGSTTSTQGLRFGDSTDTGAGYLIYNHTDNSLQIGTNGPEKVRIDSSGNLLIGKTSSGVTNNGFEINQNSGSGVTSSNNNSGNNTYHVYNTGDGAYKFYVSFGGTINAVNTSISGLSDERLKENIVDLETGLTEVMALKPRRFDWKDGSSKNIAGFIAQEVETVLPDLIDGYKHDTIKDAKSLKMGDMLPTLVKAIQEQQVLIEQLQAEVALLKGE